MYTLPLLLGIAFALFPKVKTTTARHMNFLGLALSSVYICWSLIAKVAIDHKLETALSNRGIQVNDYISTPAPLTTMLWRIVVMSDGQYYEGYASIFDDPQDITLDAYQTYPALLNSIQDEWGVKRLQWFTRGFYSVRQKEQKVILSDLRMGVECSYVFNFVVGEKTMSGIRVGDFAKVSERPDLSKVGRIWDRIWDPSISLAPSLVANDC
jgi:inner membrane protein